MLYSPILTKPLYMLANQKKREGPYYIDSTEYHVRYLVNQIENDEMIQRQKISMECLYTSTAFGNWLFSRSLTCVGTLNDNRPISLRSCKTHQNENNFQKNAIRSQKN